MPVIDSILSELEQESRNTVRMLERVPTSKLEWTPHPKSMTIGKLAWHLATIPERALVMLREGRFDFLASRPAEVPDQAALITAAFARHVEEIKVWLRSIDDAVLKEQFQLLRGPETLRTMSKMGVVRSILLNHSYHHRGQLSLYLRLLEIPVPAIYGSSADEPA